MTEVVTEELPINEMIEVMIVETTVKTLAGTIKIAEKITSKKNPTAIINIAIGVAEIILDEMTLIEVMVKDVKDLTVGNLRDLGLHTTGLEKSRKTTEVKTFTPKNKNNRKIGHHPNHRIDKTALVLKRM